MTDRERQEEFFRNPGPAMEVPVDIRRRFRRRKVLKVLMIVGIAGAIIALVIVAALNDGWKP